MVTSRWHGVSSKYFCSVKLTMLLTVQGASARFSSIPIGPAVVVSATLTVPSVDTPVEFGGLTVFAAPAALGYEQSTVAEAGVGTGGSASNCDMSSGGMAAVVVFALEVLDGESELPESLEQPARSSAAALAAAITTGKRITGLRRISRALLS